MNPRVARLSASIIAVFLTLFLIIWAADTRRNYWLMRDSLQGEAIIDEQLGHGAVKYRYFVNGKQYTGKSGRNWRDPKYSRVGPGEKAAVYFSDSHPWLSMLYKPDSVVEALPLVLIVFFLEVFAVLTIINPKSRWALNLEGTKRGRAD